MIGATLAAASILSACGGSSSDGGKVSSRATAPGSPTREASFTESVPVVRCRTTFGIRPARIAVPQRLSVLALSGTAGHLVAYTNTATFLVGPPGMTCSGIVAADGGSRITVWSPGHAAPLLHSHGDGLTLFADTACAGCRAADACPFFTSFATRLGFPCTAGTPAGEHVHRLSATVVYFSDDPGMPGDGWPSGGYDPATGLVFLQGDAPDAAVFRVTCTLPMAKSTVCADAVLNVLRRYGSPARG